jgi:hypothetical protein
VRLWPKRGHITQANKLIYRLTRQIRKHSIQSKEIAMNIREYANTH